MIFVNPYTDFGFKKLFGEEASKELLRDFLNQLLPSHHQIVTLSLKPSHRLGEILERRQAVFDLACEAASGERFVVEMQKAKQNFFKDRTVFYATFPIREQARRGEWDYRLDAVYCVGILDFVFDDEDHRQDVLTTVRLKDQHGEVFYDKLTYLYLQMPNFRKTELELESHFDKWLYFLKHLASMDDIPQILREPIFEQGFALASLAAMSEDERDAYDHSLKVYWDLNNVVNTAKDEGLAKGLAQGLAQGLAEGLAEGRAEGRAEGLNEALQLLLAAGMDEAVARKALNLTA